MIILAIIFFVILSFVCIRNIILEEKNEKLEEETKLKDTKIANLEKNISELIDNPIEKNEKLEEEAKLKLKDTKIANLEKNISELIDNSIEKKF